MSRVILNQAPHPKLPDNQDTVFIQCTRTVTDFDLVLDYEGNTEKYFEDSTTLTATLTYKSSTFILSYDRATNTFHLPNSQMNLQEGLYTLNITAKDCPPFNAPCSICTLNYSFHVAYTNALLFVDIEPVPNPPVLTCFPGDAVILKGSQPPSPAIKPQWAQLVNGQFIDIAGATSPTYTASQPGTFRYSLSGPANCSGSNIIGVSPPELPEVAIQPEIQTLIACKQKIIGVSTQNAGGSDNTRFSWASSASGIIVEGDTTSSPLVGAPGTYTLTIVRSDNGCTATAAVELVAGNIPVISTQITREPVTGRLNCRLKEIKLQATASQAPGASPFTFRWSDGTTGPNLTVDAPGIYSVTATATNNGCQGAAGLLITQDISKPQISILSPRDTICDNESIVLTAITQEPVLYVWNDNTTNSANTVSPQVNGINKYSITVTATDNGCTNSAEKDIVQVDEPQVFCQENALSVVNGEQASLSCTTSGDRLAWVATSTNVRNIAATGNGPVLNQIFQLDNIQTPGRVIYALYGSNAGCTSLPKEVVVTVLPVTSDGIFIPELITPNGDGLNDTWEILLPETITAPETYTIRLFNRNGALVYESTLATIFDATPYPDGAYYYVITPPTGETLRGAVTILRRR
ncbi:MAG: gliding motility-associated C-terminal domain-containing protein [Lewinellaceae bacterium]|nr:gliding motility-associated C-terminal domain-containing protein [Lewinellaceae bacterium]